MTETDETEAEGMAEIDETVEAEGETEIGETMGFGEANHMEEMMEH